MWPFSSAEKRSSPEDPRIPLSSPDAWKSLFGDWNSVSGVPVTIDTALTVPAVWCAVNFLSSTIAALPLQLFKKTEDGEEVDYKNPLYYLLHDAPNPEWTSFAWRKYTQQNSLTAGRGLSYIEKNKAGRPMNLWPLNPNCTTVERKGGRKLYRYREGSKEVTYGAEEILDLPYMLASDGISHVSPIMKNARSIGISIALEQYAEKFFLNGGVPPLALYGPVPSAGAAKRAAEDINEKIRAANAERKNVLLMPQGHELKAIGIDPDKSQMELARRFQVEDTARIFQLPPMFLQDLTHGTFTNTEQQDLMLTKHSLTQHTQAWEQELNLKLFSSRNTNSFVKFNIDGILRGDFATRMEGMTNAVQSALLTPNEGRALDNRKPLKGGDKLLIQGATVPLETAGTEAAKKAANDNKAPPAVPKKKTGTK